MGINRQLRRIAFIATLLTLLSHIRAIPSECDPDYILLQDEESCYKDLINISQADSQTG
ncbi:hypothetical protein DPEC_G00049390, partial [Dallia pectoralis]